jgi:hypothetical protein
MVDVDNIVSPAGMRNGQSDAHNGPLPMIASAIALGQLASDIRLAGVTYRKRP